MTVCLLSDQAGRALRKRQVPYFILVHDPVRNVYDAPPEDVPPVLVMREGKLKIGPFTIRKPGLRSDSLSWTQRSSRGYTTGHLYFGQFASELQGWMAIGESEEDAKLFNIVATALPLGQYVTQFGDDGAEAEDGPLLTLGFSCAEGASPTLVAYLGEERLTGHVLPSLDKAGRPLIEMEFQTERGGTAFASAGFLIGPDGEVTFAGSITRFSADRTMSVQSWGGSRSAQTGDTVPTEGGLPPLTFVTPVLPDLSAALTDEEVKQEQRELSALASLVPNDDDVGKKVSTMMLENMKWAMARDPNKDQVTSRALWLETYYQETAPTISDTDRQGIIAADEGWYRGTMATALIANSMSQQSFDSSVVPRPLSADQKKKIGDYVSKCLPVEEKFQAQQNQMWRFAALSVSRGLNVYVQADKKTIEDNKALPEQDRKKTWAWRLLEFFTSEERLNLLVESVTNGSSGAKPETSSEAEKPEEPEEEEEEESLEDLRKDLEALELQLTTVDPASAQGKNLKRQIKMLGDLIKIREKYEKQKEEAAQQRQQAALYNMRNVCSLLKILDPTEEIAKAYMTACMGRLTSATSAQMEIEVLRKHQEALVQQIASLFDDIASGRSQAFGTDKLAQDVLRTELEILRKKHGETTLSIAQKMTYTLTAAGGKTFLECSGNWAQAFKTNHPNLSLAGSMISRVFLATAFVFTMVRFLGSLDSMPGSEAQTEDQVRFWATFSLMAVETLRSLLPNIKILLGDLGTLLSKLSDSASAAIGPISVPEWVANIGQFVKSIASAVGQAIKRVAAKVVNVAAQVAGLAAELTIVKWIRSLCGLIGKGISIVANALGAAIQGASKFIGKISQAILTWMKTNETLTALFRFVNKWAAAAFTVVVSVAFLVLDTLDLVKAWQSDKSVEEKLLMSVQYGIGVLSVAATLIGMVVASTVWTGVGVVLGLVAVGISLLIAKLFPPESTIQKTITQVLAKFIDETAGPAMVEYTRKEKERIDQLSKDQTQLGGVVPEPVG